MIHQPQLTQTNTRALLISGLFPNGEMFSDVAHASTSYEAQIRLIAQCRYSDAGGDLEVTRLADASTGSAVPDALLSADQDLLTEVEAVEYVLYTVQNSLDTGRRTSTDPASVTLRSYVEFFDIVLSEAPQVFEALSSGDPLSSEDDIGLMFEDSTGSENELVPADALYALAIAALEEGRVAAAYQVLTMANVTRVALSKACIKALT